MFVTGSAYATAATVELLHGLEPGHGWPVAAAYALARQRRWLMGTTAGLIIGLAHLISSFAVVAVFALLDGWLGITDLPWIERLASLVLLIMASWQWRRGHAHTHSHPTRHQAHSEGRSPDHTHPHVGDHVHEHRPANPGGRSRLWGITVFAFALGFAHEEEFAILALCAGAGACWSVMAVYAVAVAASILVLTLASIATFNRLKHRLDRWLGRLPRIVAVVLGVMGLLYLIGLV